jgi:hypothetical protein
VGVARRSGESVSASPAKVDSRPGVIAIAGTLSPPATAPTAAHAPNGADAGVAGGPRAVGAVEPADDTVAGIGTIAGVGVVGLGERGAGVWGSSDLYSGVAGISDLSSGLFGSSNDGAGVFGKSKHSRGGEFASQESAQIHLSPRFLPGGEDSPEGVVAGKAGDLMAVAVRRGTGIAAHLFFCVVSGDAETARWVTVA